MIQDAEAEIKYTIMDYTTLDGWKQDNHAAAWAAFLILAVIWLSRFGKYFVN